MPSKPVKRQWMRKNSKPTRAELIKKHGRQNLEEVFLKLTRNENEF